MRATQIPCVPAVATAKVFWSGLQHEHTRPGFTSADGSAKRGVPAARHKYIIDPLDIHPGLRSCINEMGPHTCSAERSGFRRRRLITLVINYQFKLLIPAGLRELFVPGSKYLQVLLNATPRRTLLEFL